jgi:N-acetylglucosaminyl-diphospho-decaprenol L-rhamnosyltransferase
MHSLADVTCLFVTYNSAAVIGRALVTVPPDCPVIVVDNASTDASIQTALATRPDARIIASGQNLGYGTAANRGIEQATTPFVFLLNPDVFLQPDTLPTLLAAAAQYPDHAIFGPASYNADGVEQITAKPALFQPGHELFRPVFRNRQQKAIALQQPIATGPVGWIMGGAMLFRLAALQNIGLFDENIFLFFEETDLCYRAVQAGKPPVFVPEARLTHLVAGSSGSTNRDDAEARRYRMFECSRYYLARKYRRETGWFLPLYHQWRYRWKLISYRLLGRKTRSRMYAARLAGVRDFRLC